MINIVNTDQFKVKWFACKKYDFDHNNALASGVLQPNTSTTYNNPTTVSIIFALRDGVAAACICGDGGTAIFYNDPNGCWCHAG